MAKTLHLSALFEIAKPLAEFTLKTTVPYQFDLHCHSLFSADGVSSPEALIAAARRRGLHGFAMTDHNTCEAIDYMLKKGLMREDGHPVDGFLVIPGVEVTTDEGHLLCLGAKLPNLKGHPAAEVCDRIHEAGGIAVPPHPYDIFRAGIRRAVLDTLPIDAIEVFNAATTFARYNKKAFKYAQERGLPMTSSSDAHHEDAVGSAYTIMETPDFTVQGIINQIMRPNKLNQTYLKPKEKFRKTWNNWLRLKRKRPKLDV